MCECKFHQKYDDDDKGSWHFHRVCAYCATEWAGLHCVHDGYQNPCPKCGLLPAMIHDNDDGGSNGMAPVGVRGR